MTRKRMASLVAACVTLASGEALAQQPERAAQAETLFERGKAAMTAGDLEHACPALAESMRIEVGVGVALWLGDCYERQGKSASAWATFNEAASLAKARGDKRESIAAERAQKLEGRLARVQIVIGTPAFGLVVKQDDAALSPSLYGVATPIDPGLHVFAASAPGYAPWRKDVTIADGANVRIEPSLVSTAAPQPAPTAPPEATTRETRAGSTQRIVGVAVAGAGVVGLGLSAVLAVSAKSRYDDSSAHCVSNACDPDGLSIRDSAYGRATVATVFFAVGLTAVAAGAVLWLTAPRGAVTGDLRSPH